MLSLGGLASTASVGRLNLRNIADGRILRWWAANIMTPSFIQWNDEIIGDTTWQQSNATNIPTLTTTPSGYPAILFDNVDDEMNGVGPMGPLDGANVGEYLWSICYQSGVQTPTTYQGVDLVTGSGDGMGVNNNGQGAASNKFCITCGVGIAAANGATADNVIDTNWHTYIATVRESTGVAKLWVDGVLQSKQGSGQSMRALLNAGFIEMGSTGSSSLNGAVASRFFIYNKNYFDTQVIDNIAAYQYAIINGAP